MEKLTPAEEQAMQAIWKTGETNIKGFLEQITEPKPPYTTLASTVKNLEKKGYLSSRLVGNAYLYKPAITTLEFKKQSVGAIVKDHFGNSYKDLVSFFAQQKKLSTKDLKEIIRLIESKK